MLIISGTIKVKPETRADAIAAAQELMRLTQAETGCRTYRFSSALDDPNLFLIYEEWEDEAALMSHFATPHMAAFNTAVPRFLAGAPSITRYDVSGSTKLM